MSLMNCAFTVRWSDVAIIAIIALKLAVKQLVARWATQNVTKMERKSK